MPCHCTSLQTIYVLALVAVISHASSNHVVSGIGSSCVRNSKRIAIGEGREDSCYQCKNVFDFNAVGVHCGTEVGVLQYFNSDDRMRQAHHSAFFVHVPRTPTISIRLVRAERNL